MAVASDGNLAGANLAFYSWALADPPQRSAEEEAKEAALAARYSGLSPGGTARQPRLLLVGSTAATPAPSVAASSSGCGVLWSDDGSRFAVCTSHAVHIMAVSVPTTSAATRQATVVELCRAPLVAVSATWDGASGLLVATADARTVLVLPPLVLEPRLLCGAGAGDALAMASRARGLTPALVDVQSLLPPPDFGAAISCGAGALPVARRGTGNPAHCCPIAIMRNHAITLHWVGARGSSGGLPSLGAGSGAPAVSPGSTLVIGTAPLLSPAVRAARALVQSYRSVNVDTAAQYTAAVVSAAQWASRLPREAHDDVALLFASIGGLAAALMLPGLLPEHGIPLVLARRSDVFNVAQESGPSSVDAAVAVAYLCRISRGLDGGRATNESKIRALAGGHGHAADVGATGGALGAWPQVAAFLAIASRAIADRGSGSDVGDALQALARRCLAAGFSFDAALVAAASSSAADSSSISWAQQLLDEALRQGHEDAASSAATMQA